MNQQAKPKTKFALGDYVEVSERIAAWYEEYPEGRIETDIVTMSEKLVVTRSRVYKSDDDKELPAGVAHSMLAIPGKTPYTRDSELENCETSSVGRALVMAGIPSKSVASSHEIRTKRSDDAPRDKPPYIPPPTTADAAKKVAAEHGMETADALITRQANEDKLIAKLAADIETHADYPEAFRNVITAIGKANDEESGRFQGIVKTILKPRVLEILAKHKALKAELETANA